MSSMGVAIFPSNAQTASNLPSLMGAQGLILVLIALLAIYSSHTHQT